MTKLCRNLSLILLSACALGLINAPITQINAQTGKSYKFINGNWFNGKNFAKQVFYAVDGTFANKAPGKIDETIDLQNGYVIPPFADAHTHNLDGKSSLEKLTGDYLKEGTFYVQVLGNYATGAQQARPLLNKPSTLDVAYANGGLTSTLGHPFMAYEPRAQGFYNPADWKANMEKIKLGRRGENNVYWFFDSLADVDAKWENYLAQKPDVAKIFLLDAKNYEKLHNNGNAGDKGLSPVVAEYVVKKAHEANLRVYAHIETIDDFRLGLKIGVDGFAHAPNYVWSGKLEDPLKDDLTLADIKLAARKKIIIIPTAQWGEFAAVDYSGTNAKPGDERMARVVQRQKRLYNLMVENGVLALGSDNFGKTLSSELWYLHDHKILDNLTLIKLAAEVTPRVVFPNRKIGKLAAGYEASFLVLPGDPLKDFNQIKNINLRFKQGNVITLQNRQN